MTANITYRKASPTAPTGTTTSSAPLTSEEIDGNFKSVVDAIDSVNTNKADKASPTFTGTVSLPSTTSIGSVSDTELSYVNGVTSGIQGQLDNKASKGVNNDITQLNGLTTALSVSQGGTGLTSPGTSGNILTSNGTTWVSSTPDVVAPRNTVSVRQTVASGTSSSGDSNFLLLGSGTTVYMNHLMYPVVINFAYGFDSYGSVDYTWTIDNGVTDFFSAVWTTTLGNLNVAGTHYLFATRNISTGATSVSSTQVQPIYSYSIPSSPVGGQYWYNINKAKMYLYTGVTWSEQQVVFVGEVYSSGSALSNLITYALNGKYQSDIIAKPALSTTTVFKHGIGTTNININAFEIVVTEDVSAGYTVGAILPSNVSAHASTADTVLNPLSVTDINYLKYKTTNQVGLYPNPTTGTVASFTDNNLFITAQRNF